MTDKSEPEFVSLERIAALADKLAQGQIPSAESQAEAWSEVLNGLRILFEVAQHAYIQQCESGCAQCELQDVAAVD